jgi:lipopolysaccharide/colanic/teichoic acid biosynthesis glycosyltransferase
MLWVWKFRTMVMNADTILADCLQHDEKLQAEWTATHKLKDDPRVTRVGRFLRKTSLDELPQLLNVVHNEMSLVGPRPIVDDEIQHYATSYRMYTQVRPGLTGLWQVSGRSDTSYAYRVSLDEYYVRHWSIWMDLYILARTLWVVAKGSGAY